jgi:DNA polymerase-3 subunit beta
MKFTVTSNELLNALNKVIGVTPARSTLPILGNVYLSLENKELTLIGSDLEVYVKVVLNVNGKQDGKVAVPAKKLETLIQNLLNKELSFELQQNFKLSIKTKGGKWTITGEDPNDFPMPAEIEQDKKVTIDNILLSKYLAKAIHAASPDELRRSMNGVFLEIKEGEFRVVSTDGHRLVRIIKNDFDYSGDKFALLVPIKTCNMITKLFKTPGRSAVTEQVVSSESEVNGDKANTEESSSEIDTHSDITVYLSNEFLQCYYNNITITSRLIDDTFPNYESVIPTDNEKILKVERVPLMGSIKRSIIMSDQVTNRTSFNINSNELKVKSANNEYGTDSEETIDCNFTENEEFEIAFNGKYLLEALQQFECAEVLFDFSSPLKASVLRPSEQGENEDMMMLVMPVRNI